MKRTSYILFLSLLALVACAKDPAPVVARDGEPPVTSFSAEDAEMSAAIAKAQATLPEFERRLKEPPASQVDISLKARFEEGEDVEHMWVNTVEITATGYRAILGNHPVHIKSIDVGSRVEIRRENVSDWMAIDDGKLVGGYTLRVQLAHMTPEQRQQILDESGFTIED